MFNVWGDLVYGINHTFQVLSYGMKGGDNQYFVTSRDYGSGFMETLMDSNLVHLMLMGKCDSLPLSLGSRWMCIALVILGFVVCLCVEVWPWRPPLACEGKPR